jgi:hypothetical protein
MRSSAEDCLPRNPDRGSYVPANEPTTTAPQASADYRGGGSFFGGRRLRSDRSRPARAKEADELLRVHRERQGRDLKRGVTGRIRLERVGGIGDAERALR